MLKLAICDNDKTFLAFFENMIAECGNVEITSFLSSDSLTEFTSSNETDCIFLDIELDNGCSGIDVAVEIVKNNPDVKIVFMSSYSERYCQQIFLSSPLLKPFGFIAKPPEKDIVQKIIEQLNETEEAADSEFFIIKTRKGSLRIDLSKLMYIESDKRKALFYCTDEKYESYYKLGDIAKLLPNQFCMCHKSYIINMDFVKFFKNQEIILENDTVIPVSRTYAKQIRENIVLYRGLKS